MGGLAPALAPAQKEGTPLLQRGPSPLHPDVLGTAWEQLQALVRIPAAADLPAAWVLGAVLAGGILVGLVLGLALRRGLARVVRAGAGKAGPSRWILLLRGLAGALRRRAFSLTVPLALVAVIEIMGARSVAAGFLAETALLLLLIYRLGIGLFPVLVRPFESDGLERRLADPAIQHLWHAGRGLFALTAVVAFLGIAAETLTLPRELRGAVTLAVALAAAWVLWILRRGEGWRHLAADAEGHIPPLRAVAIGLGRLAGAAVALALPLLAAAGYQALAGFLLFNLLVSVLVLLAAGALATGLGRGVHRLGRMRPPEPLAPVVTPERLSAAFQIAAALARGVVLLAGLVGVLALWGLPVGAVWAGLEPLLFGFPVGQYELSLVALAAAIAVAVGTFYVGRRVRTSLRDRLLARLSTDPGLRNSMASLAYYAVVVLGLLIAVSVAGFDLTNLAIIAGALSVGIGFGLQNIVNNFISGLILLFERPIKVGDVVEYQKQWAEVLEIRVRSTVVRTYDRAELIVPNSELVSSTVTNWTHSDYRVRIIIPVSVAFGSDTHLVRDLLLQAVNEHPNTYADPPPYVLFREFGEGALSFEVRFYTHLENYLSIQSDIRFRIDELFREHGVTIPFPQRDVHLYGQGPGPEGAPA